MPALPEIERFAGEMTAWRRDLHAHPELGFEEQRTADFVARKLAAWGIEVHRAVGRTGVVGVLRTGSSARSVGLRADMDALPIEEANTFEHRSRHAGRMHACGHDGHTAMLLGAARYLAETRRFDGTVVFVFQPAEEGLGGAQAMIADGLFRRFPCDAIYGLHNRPGLPVGAFAVRPGPMMAGGAFFDINIEGVGAHAARPEAGVDPVLAGAHLVVALQSVVARNVRPLDTAVLSVTRIHGGDAYNVIPERVRLSGTARAFSDEVMRTLGERVGRLADGVAAGFGARARTDFRVVFPPLVNDAREAEFVAAVCAELAGDAALVRDPPLNMASEDFACMLREVPGCFFNVGNGAGPGACEVHNPHYDFNDAALVWGASALARLAERRLAR
ncbi:MAG: M20 family metallopeptidase [Burkholderiales bacterium]|nr:M20 family metallopeptidase [Burkholderiales bacterium]